MSAHDEIKQATDQIIAAATKGDFGPLITALDDEVEVFSEDVPYRFDGKESILSFCRTRAQERSRPPSRSISHLTGP